jgi:hypothetical protein
MASVLSTAPGFPSEPLQQEPQVRQDQERGVRRLSLVSRFGQRADARSLNRGRCAGGPARGVVAPAPSGDHVGVVDEPVDERGGDHGVAEDLAASH